MLSPSSSSVTVSSSPSPCCACQVGPDRLPANCHHPVCCSSAGDVGLEIAPGNEVEDLKLIEDVGNIWNHVPVAREWTPLDPR